MLAFAPFTDRPPTYLTSLVFVYERNPYLDAFVRMARMYVCSVDTIAMLPV